MNWWKRFFGIPRQPVPKQIYVVTERSHNTVIFLKAFADEAKASAFCIEQRARLKDSKAKVRIEFTAMGLEQ